MSIYLKIQSPKVFLGSTIPPNKDHPIHSFDELHDNSYDLLILPGGVKSMEKVRLEKMY